jgi:LuxR family maltose regulon positive regulatory protein
MNTFDTGLVLTTKLQRPNLPGDFIPRPKLIEYVNIDLQRPLTLVSAGAGYGKSTFVSSWFNEISQKNCWLSLDENDNDLRTLFVHFISAIRTVIPDFGMKTAGLLNIPDMPGINILKNTLINDLNELPETVFLALDDFHIINNQDIIDIFTESLKFPPKNFHLVIISRNDPVLPLSCLRAKNKMKEIRSSHLQLTQYEIKSFVESHLKIYDAEMIAQKLNSGLEGWFTGLRFAVLHLSLQDIKGESINLINFSSGNSDSYFMDEILEHLDGDMLNFLLKTSILHKFSSDIADYLLQNKNGRAQINKLVNNNLFIINLDNRGEWYRYHHVFHGLLQKELIKRFSEKEVSFLKLRAVKWFEEHGMINEAITLASQSGDTEGLIALIEKYMHVPLNEDKWYVLEQWLDKIPANYIDQSPDLLIARMWILQHKNIFWAIPGLLTKLDELLQKQKLNKDTELQVMYFKGVIRFWSAEIKESMALFKTVLDNISSERIGAYSLTNIYYGTASQQNGTAQPVYREAEEILQSGRLHPTFKILLLGELIYMRVLEGDLYRVKQLLKKQLKISLSVNDIFAQAWINYLFGYVAFQNYDLGKAEAYFEQALNNVYYLNMTAPMDSFAGMLLTQKMLNKQKEYQNTYHKMLSFVSDKAHPVYTSLSYSLRARISLHENDLEAANKWIKLTDMSFSSGNVLYDIEVPRLTECRVLLAHNDPVKTGEALQKLRRHLKLAERINNTPFLINTLVLLAVAYNKQQNNKSAEDVLTQALQKAHREKWIFPFMESGKEIQHLLTSLKAKGALKKFILDILRAIPHNAVSKKRKKLSGIPENYFDNLTNRELDVLDLMAKRFSNKEIAEALFISPGTVKRHTINLFKKLDVHKRREAVLKAQHLGILKT